MQKYTHKKTTLISLVKSYPCIHFNNEYWNGWLVPRVTKNVRDEIIKDLRQLGKINNLEEQYEEMIEDYLSDGFEEIDGVEYTNIGVGLCWEEEEND